MHKFIFLVFFTFLFLSLYFFSLSLSLCPPIVFYLHVVYTLFLICIWTTHQCLGLFLDQYLVFALVGGQGSCSAGGQTLPLHALSLLNFLSSPFRLHF